MPESIRELWSDRVQGALAAHRRELTVLPGGLESFMNGVIPESGWKYAAVSILLLS